MSQDIAKQYKLILFKLKIRKGTSRYQYRYRYRHCKYPWLNYVPDNDSHYTLKSI